MIAMILVASDEAPFVDMATTVLANEKVEVARPQATPRRYTESRTIIPIPCS